MMRYRYRPYGRQNRGYRRRMRGMYGFPWIFIFFLIFYTGWWQWFIVGIVVSALLGMFLKSTMNSASAYDQQQPYYQPSQQQTYYQPNAQQEYQQYQQGYQPVQPSAPVQDVDKQTGQEQVQTETYQDYEQPQTEYPQQMPPM